MADRPPQRLVPARVHTGSGWLSGTVHLPRMQGFLDFLSSGERYLSLTDVSLPGQRRPIPFFALRRSAAHLVIPTCAEWLVGTGALGEARVERMVCCLLQLGTVTGRLEMVPAVRVSDFVADRDGFLLLRHAILGPDHEPAPLVFVNARACVGIGDLGPQAPRLEEEEEVVELELESPPPGPDMPA